MSVFSYDVSLADFDQKVLAASRQVPVIVDFWAPWCQPCRILKPMLEKLAAEYGGKFLLAKINSDENQELAAQYGVRGIPAVKAFVDGKLRDEFTGALPEAQIREFLQRLIPSPAEALRLEAQALAQAGDTAAARGKLGEALKLDKRHEASYLDYIQLCLDDNSPELLEEASQLLTAVAPWAKDAARVSALQAQLNLLGSGNAGEVEDLQAVIAKDENDHASRLKLANALALQQDYRAALEQLLEIVRRDRRWNEEAGRKNMLNLFSLLASQPQHEGLVREFRLALSRTLN